MIAIALTTFHLHSAFADSNNSLFTHAREVYPFALIGDAYGLLKGDDLALTLCRFGPMPFNENKGGGRYWQCFSTSKVQFDCGTPYFVENEEELQTIFAYTASEQGVVSEYLPRRHVPLSVCKSLQSSWELVAKNQKYVCLMGVYDGKRTLPHKSPSVKKLGWTWESVKSKRKCLSEFPEDCSLKVAIKNGCKP